MRVTVVKGVIMVRGPAVPESGSETGIKRMLKLDMSHTLKIYLKTVFCQYLMLATVTSRPFRKCPVGHKLYG